MKRLTISYDGMVLHDGEVDELAFSDSDAQVAVTGRRVMKKAANTAAVAGIGDLLARASKARTAASADKLKEAAADD